MTTPPDTDRCPSDRTEEPALPGPPPEVALPPLGAVGWVRWAWRQLTSMRTALLLLLLLAVAAVPGSVFPQRRINPGRVEEYLADHTGYGPWLDRLGFFDVYSSIWFSAIYLLLFVSLVGCVLPRTRAHLRALRAAPPRTPRRLERLPAHTRVAVDTPADDVLDALAATLRRRRYRVARHDGVSVSAERGYLAETGNLVFHLALLGLLVAVAVGSLVGLLRAGARGREDVVRELRRVLRQLRGRTAGRPGEPRPARASPSTLCACASRRRPAAASSAPRGSSTPT